MPNSNGENKNPPPLINASESLTDFEDPSYREVPLTPVRMPERSPVKNETTQNLDSSENIQDSPEKSKEAEEKKIPRTSAQLENKPKELTVTTLINLLGLPTSKQVSLLDSKMDLILTKFSSLQRTTESLYNQVSAFEANSQTERIEFRVNEILSVMKKFFPVAFKLGSENIPDPQNSQTKTKVLTNSPNSTETKVFTDVLESKAGIPKREMSDEEFQNDESKKLKKEMSVKYED